MLSEKPQTETGEPGPGNTDHFGDSARLETERAIHVEETVRFLQDQVLDAQTDSAIGHFIISNVRSIAREESLSYPSSNSSRVAGQSSLSRRESARSASSLPPVWQVAQ